MSLRKKILTLIGLTILGLLALLYLTAQGIVLGGFAQLEEDTTRQNVQRALNAVADEIASLNATTGDWAPWDDTYSFIQDGNQEYVDVNLVDSVYTNLRLNLTLYLNNSADLVYGRAFDLVGNTETPIPADLNPYLVPNSPLLDHPDEQSSVSGVLNLAGGTLLFASRPILTSEFQGPIRGTLIFARYLDSAQIEQLSDTTQLSIAVYPVADPALPSDFEAALTPLADSPIIVRTLGNDSIAGYTLISDVYNNPALVLRVETPRDIYQHGQASVSYFMLALVIIAVVFAAVTLLLLDRIVVSRLARLSGSVAAASDLTARVTVDGSDELATLAGKINTMLASLEQSQQTLHESEQRLRTVINNAPIILWAIDRRQMFTLAEGQGLQALKMQPADIVGRTAPDLLGVVPQLEADIQRAFTGESAASLVGIQHATFDTRSTPLRDQSGEIVGVIGVATNVTEKLRAESALGETSANLEARNRQLARAQEYFNVTLTQLKEAVQRGAPRDELLNYLRDVDTQFGRLR